MRSASTRASSKRTKRSTDAGNPAVGAALAVAKWSPHDTIVECDAYVVWGRLGMRAVHLDDRIQWLRSSPFLLVHVAAVVGVLWTGFS